MTPLERAELFKNEFPGCSCKEEEPLTPDLSNLFKQNVRFSKTASLWKHPPMYEIEERKSKEELWSTQAEEIRYRLFSELECTFHSARTRLPYEKAVKDLYELSYTLDGQAIITDKLP